MLPPEADTDSPDLYDGPWKLGIDDFLPQLMLLLFPASHAEIDWSRSYQCLNHELPVLLPAEEGASPRYADALYQVWRRDGRAHWLVLHLEVQSQPDPDLPRRMYVYSYRCFEKYGSEVFGFAILGDRNPAYRPMPYAWELGNARMVYAYDAVKLLDFPLAELEASDNPAALLVLAHRYTAETKGDQDLRRRFKLRLIRLLVLKGYSDEHVRKLLKILDWLMRLDPEQGIIFAKEAKSLQEQPEMEPYVNTFELYGRHLGAKRILQSQLVRRFGELPAWIADKLATAPEETLVRWSLQLLDAHSLDEVFA